MIDLHTHSTFSDGSLTPEQLVEAACRAGLTAVALTDHDCTDGHPRFLAACDAARRNGYRDGRGLVGVPGVEISSDVPHGTLHMLGYFIDRSNADLEAALSYIRDGRAYRNEQILARLNELGLELAWEEVAAYAGEDVVGRPHFAQAMLARGYVGDKQEAFDRYLGKGQKAYVDRFRLTPEDSVKKIVDAGGIAVLAHPFTLDTDAAGLRRVVGELVDLGLGGIEVLYSEHSPEQRRLYAGLADEFNLVATGGTDFHGDINPDVRLGVGFGNLAVPDDVLDRLAERHTARQAG